MKKGKFIVFEGCEGAGKTTQIDNLKKKYPDALFVREIGGTDFAEKGPRYLVLTSPYSKDLNGYEQITQAFSGRSHHVRKVIEPALKEGRIVICDRFDASSFAYQIYGMECHHLFDLFASLKASIVPLIAVDMYIILDVPPEIGMQRTKKRAEDKGESNYFDTRGPEFHARVRNGYQEFAKLNPSRSMTIDATGSKDEVWELVQNAISKAL